jgi:hypothetical protein
VEVIAYQIGNFLRLSILRAEGDFCPSKFINAAKCVTHQAEKHPADGTWEWTSNDVIHDNTLDANYTGW